MVRHERALVAFHLERLGHHRHGENAQLLRDLCHNRCRTGAGAAAHTRGDEEHVATFDELHDTVAIFHRGLTTDFRVGARAESLGDVAADLQRRLYLGVLQGLRVSIDAHEFHTVDTAGDHVCNGVPAAATHTDHLDDGALAIGVHQFKHVARSSYLCLSASKVPLEPGTHPVDDRLGISAQGSPASYGHSVVTGVEQKPDTR